METTTELFGAKLVHIIQGTNADAHKILLRKRQETGLQDGDPQLDFLELARTYWGLADSGANVEGIGLVQLLMFVDPASVMASVLVEAYKVTSGAYPGGPLDKFYVNEVTHEDGKLRFKLSGTAGRNIDISAMVFLRDFRPAVRLDTVAGRFSSPPPPPIPHGVTPLHPRKKISRRESPHNANWADKTGAQLRQMCTDLSAQLEMIASGKAELAADHAKLKREYASALAAIGKFEGKVLKLSKDKDTLQVELDDAMYQLRLLRASRSSVRKALFAKFDDFLQGLVGPQKP